MDFKPIDPEQLKLDYNNGNGLSIRCLARRHQTSPLTIKRKLEKAGVIILNSNDYINLHKRQHQTASAPNLDLTNELLQELWTKGLSIAAISRQTGTSEPRIRTLVKKLNLKPHQHQFTSPINYWWNNHQWLQEHFIDKQLSLNELAKITSSTPETIKKYLLKHGFKLRTLCESIIVWNNNPTTKEIRSAAAKKGYSKTKDKLNIGRARYLASLPQHPYYNKNWLESEYNQKGILQIAREQDVHPVTIRYWLIKFNLHDPARQSFWTEDMKEQARQRTILMWTKDYEKLAIRSETQKDKISKKLIEKFQDPTIRAKAIKAYEKSSSSRGVIGTYQSIKGQGLITFRSLLECGYAIFLDRHPAVISWEYETIRMPYQDGFTGRHRTYILDFKISYEDRIEYIEVKPPELQQPLTKYLYAENNWENWRFTTAVECLYAMQLFSNGYNQDRISFIHTWPNKQYYIAWAKSNTPIYKDGWELIKIIRFKKYYKLRYRNKTQCTK